MFESRSSDQPNSGEAFDQDRAEGPSGDRCRAENVGAVVWAHIHLPVVQPDGWSDYHLRMGMRELERLRRETEAAMALLTGAMPESRDTVADIARNAGISNREARRRKSVADVCGKVKGAFEKLKSGAISNEHVSALAPVADMPGAEGLLDDAASKSPEELARDVEEFRLLSACGEDMAKRQRARRSLRFSSGPEGMIGINGLLPPVEGTELKNRLAAMVDAKWRAAHPTRAKELGGHGGDSHDQRMADALLEMAGVRSGQEGSQSRRDSQNGVPCEATQSPGSTEVAEVADLSEGSSRKTSACDQTNRPGQTPGTPKADQTNRPGETAGAPKADQENRPGETAGAPKADQENRPGETAGAPKADQANRPRETTGTPKADQTNRPGEAVSMNVGLRLAGLGGRMIQGEPPDGSCANGPPGAGATTVKTGKPAVVIVFDIDKWKARIAGGSPIPITESLLDQARNDLYYCFKNTVGEVIKFGRSRRDPSPIQRLVLVVRDEKCLYPGCYAPPDACDAHHTNEVVKDRGNTDTDVMGLFCEAHHRHIHINDLVVKRNPDGSISIIERRTGAIVASTIKKRAA